MLLLPRYPEQLLDFLSRAASSLFPRTHAVTTTPPYPETLISLLSQTAAKYPSKGLKLYDNGLDSTPVTITYSELLRVARLNGQKLLDIGLVSPGQIVVLYFEDHFRNVLWTWSIIAAGAVPAILSPLSNDEKTLAGQLENLDNLFGSPILITSKDLVARFNSRPGLRIHDTETIEIAGSPASSKNVTSYAEPPSDSLAVILFTSGSTGHSKGVEFTHKQLILSAVAKNELHQVTPKTNFMAWISFDHSANFCELHLNAMNAGADMVMVSPSDMVQDPGVFYELLSRHRIGYSFAPNFFLAAATSAVNARVDDQQRLDFSALRVVMVGGEANRTSSITAADGFVRKYGGPEHSIKAAYGLSETCSACFYNLESPGYDVERDNAFASVGKHLPRGIEHRIADEEGHSLPHETQGRIQLRGEIIFKRYYNNAAATADCMTSDGWFDTGDLGYTDSLGNLLISGRRKEILILNGNNYSSFELEHAIQTVVTSGITQSYVASFSTWDTSAQSEGVIILFNPADNIINNEVEIRKVMDSISKACVSFCSKYPTEVVPLPREEMPKSTIGKLSRQKLKQYYEKGAFDRYKRSEQSDLSSNKPLNGPRQEIIAKVLAEKTGQALETIGADTPIMRSGIDSLTYLRMKHELQYRLNLPTTIPLPLLLRADTIEDLDVALTKLEADYTTSGGGNEAYDPIMVLRKAGSKTPLFLCHPGGGEVLNWLGLLNYLPDRPVYALRARGLQAGEKPINQLEEMLKLYEAGIRRVQPHGPYAIFGLCFGGLLSFELAKRLEAAGETVAFCGGIDNPPKLNQINPNSSFKRFLLQLLAFHGLFTLAEANRLEREVYADVKEEEPDVFVDRVLSGFADKATQMDLNKEKIRLWMHVLFGSIEIVNAYQPTGKIANYDVFIASQSPDEGTRFEEWKGMVTQWSELTHNFGAYQVQGDHFSTLNPPYLDILQREVNKALRHRGI